MNNEIFINKRAIGPHQSPYIIAEMSGNHNGSLERALQIIEEAAKAGANAVKLQTYTADTITLNCNEGEFFIKDSENLWDGNSLYELYKKAYTPWEWHEKLFKKCKEKNITCFSSPFDETAVDFLEELDAPAYKIASFENNHLPMIEKIARLGKPIIISTGMASFRELTEVIELIKKQGNENIVLLKCTSSYPANAEDANLKTIPHLREALGVQVGLSDHSMGETIPITAVALGATVIEKHLTLNRNDGGVDSSFSMEPEDLKNLVKETQKSWHSLGCIHYGTTNSEKTSYNFRRSIYISQDIKKGETINKKNVQIIRPGHGLEPKFFNQILGSQIKRSASKGTPLTWDLLL